MKSLTEVLKIIERNNNLVDGLICRSLKVNGELGLCKGCPIFEVNPSCTSLDSPEIIQSIRQAIRKEKLAKLLS